jgi:predicted amidohydrolase YtcJ
MGTPHRISRDIFSVKPDSIGKTRVLTTMVAGKVVFSEGK